MQLDSGPSRRFKTVCGTVSFTLDSSTPVSTPASRTLQRIQRRNNASKRKFVEISATTPAHNDDADDVSDSKADEKMFDIETAPKATAPKTGVTPSTDTPLKRVLSGGTPAASINGGNSSDSEDEELQELPKTSVADPKAVLTQKLLAHFFLCQTKQKSKHELLCTKQLFWLNDVDIKNLSGRPVTNPRGRSGSTTVYDRRSLIEVACSKYKTVHTWNRLVAAKKRAQKQREQLEQRKAAERRKAEERARAQKKQREEKKRKKQNKHKGNKRKKRKLSAGKDCRCGNTASAKCNASDGKHYCKNCCPGLGCSQHKKNTPADEERRQKSSARKLAGADPSKKEARSAARSAAYKKKKKTLDLDKDDKQEKKKSKYSRQQYQRLSDFDVILPPI
jgi:hypothetical protein